MCKGHVDGGDFYSHAESKLQTVLNFPTLTNKTQIRSVLGLGGYYVHYILNFSMLGSITRRAKGKKENVMRMHFLTKNSM